MSSTVRLSHQLYTIRKNYTSTSVRLANTIKLILGLATWDNVNSSSLDGTSHALAKRGGSRKDNIHGSRANNVSPIFGRARTLSSHLFAESLLFSSTQLPLVFLKSSLVWSILSYDFDENIYLIHTDACRVQLGKEEL